MQERKKHKGTEKYKEIDKEIRHMCKERKETWWNEKCKESGELERKQKTKEMHAKVKEMSTKKRSKSGTNCIRPKNVKMLFDSNDAINRWVEHVTELYHDERGDTTDVSNQNGCNIMKSEIENVIKEMKCGKASGNDDIATEMIKALDDEGIKKITELCNLVYDTGYLPPDMSSSIFVRPKKAKATKCSDYRTLSYLMSNILKILLKVILKRNKTKIESVISETQRGFMAGKGTREEIYNLRTIIERYIKCGKSIYLCFIDYETAFDTVKHAKIIECMENLDMDGKEIRLIINLYWTQKPYMRTEDGLSPEIHIKRRVRQGCVLSPCLFNLYTENIFGAINTNNGITIGGTTIYNLRYADDTVLLAETEEDLQEI